jgi:hypothetical protein
MAGTNINPRDFGVDMEREDFVDLMVGDFNEAYLGRPRTVDELLLHPREAARFCDEVRRKHGHCRMPDDVILRVILQRRKSPPVA